MLFFFFLPALIHGHLTYGHTRPNKQTALSFWMVWYDVNTPFYWLSVNECPGTKNSKYNSFTEAPTPARPRF